MAHEIDLRKYETVPPNSGTKDNDSLQADLGIRIISLGGQGQGPFDFTLFGPLINDPDLNLHGVSHRTRNDMFALAEECRKTWKSAIVDRRGQTEVNGKTKFAFPFQDDWNIDEKILDEIVPLLAQAGDKLFTLIFERQCDDGLKEIGQTIRNYMGSGDRRVAITSDTLFQPWGMLYTHPGKGAKLEDNGSNAVKEGFWGYQHIVQQTSKRYKLENAIRPDASGTVPTSINFDDRLSVAMNLPIIDKHIQFLRHLGAKITRTKKSELEVVFKHNRCSLERIVYFYCHGHGSEGGASMSPAYLELTDDSVSASDFQLWANGEKLPTNPLVFINACEGGQMTNMFYQSFAVELLEEGAVGLIGAQIDVPAVFAVEYAKEIFEKFFDRTNTQKERLGLLLKKVNQNLWETSHNPLGLVYSLYRGVDCFIDWPVASVVDAAASPIPKNALSS